jgi:hypothetical protein
VKYAKDQRALSVHLLADDGYQGGIAIAKVSETICWQLALAER